MSQQKVSPQQSILAGFTAGGAESLITYPTEYLKTRQQLQKTTHQSAPRILISTIRDHCISHLYTGSMAFCLSNACKSGVRLFAFNTVRQWMPIEGGTKTSPGKVTPFGNMFAGILVGVAESVLVVTPGETLKTKIIDDQGRKYKSAVHAVRSIVSTEGVQGLYREVLPVTLKQSANAMVRFTSYNILLNQLQAWGSQDSHNNRPSKTNTVIAGALAEVINVYATMPFDTLKTRLQAIDGRQRYTGTFDCLRSILSNEGARILWRGTTPRLARLSISGALTFTIYETVIEWMSAMSLDKM